MCKKLIIESNPIWEYFFWLKCNLKKHNFFFCCAWRLNLEMQNHIYVFLSNETASKLKRTHYVSIVIISVTDACSYMVHCTVCSPVLHIPLLHFSYYDDRSYLYKCSLVLFFPFLLIPLTAVNVIVFHLFDVGICNS